MLYALCVGGKLGNMGTEGKLQMWAESLREAPWRRGSFLWVLDGL